MNTASTFERRRQIQAAMQQHQAQLDDLRQQLEQAPPMVGNGAFLASLTEQQQQRLQIWLQQNWTLQTPPVDLEALVKARREADQRVGKLLQLQAELDADDGYDDTTLLLFLNHMDNAAALTDIYRPDPVLPQEPVTQHLPQTTAADLIQARAALDQGRFTNVNQVTAALSRPEFLPHLHYSALAFARQTPAPVTVGVLLPLRLETRFITKPDGLWLHLRITPDEPWMDRFTQQPLKHEYGAFAAFLAATWQTFTTRSAQDAWRTFCQEVGPQRAAWLYRHWPREQTEDRILPARPQDFAGEAIESRIRDFPKSLRVHIQWDHLPGQELDLEVKPEQLTFDMRPAEDPDAKQWWWDWPSLKSVGLGAQIKLASPELKQLAAIYVYGMSDQTPHGLFEAKAAAGELSFAPLGMPTNAVNGGKTVPQTFTVGDWYHFTRNPDAADIDTARVNQSMFGAGAGPRHVPRTQEPQQALDQALVRALWYPLWGYHFKHIAQGDAGADALGCWAAENLIPEGPLPPLLINDQPYGVLPTTALSRWRAHPRDPQIESRLTPVIRYLRNQWAKAAAGPSGEDGTVVGTDSNLLLALLGHTASNPSYDWWPCIGPLSSALLFGGDFPELNVERFAQAWRERSQGVLEMGYRTARYYYPQSAAPASSRLPLSPTEVAAQTFRQFMNDLIQDTTQNHATFRRRLAQHDWLPLPNTLLERLLLMARLMTMAEIGAGIQPMSLLYPEAGWEDDYTPLERAVLVPKWDGQDLSKVEHDHQKLYHAYQDALPVIRDASPQAVERAFRATLDTSTNRIDPWVTGLSWSRLRRIRHHADYKLGAYGWVDRPLLERAGPTDAGYLLTPGQNQGDAAVILRDKAVQTPGGRWDMNLDSRTVRMAAALAQEVKTGSHLNEAVGRAVERILEQRQPIRQIRERYPLRTEHQERRPCDGIAALPHLLGPQPIIIPQPSQLEALRDLEAALDSYGDLLVAQSVHQVVNGTADRAAQAMEAAAGLASPPELDVINTQRAGMGVHTTVSFAVPHVPQPQWDPAEADIRWSPLLIADASVATYLNTRFGEADDPAWTWILEHTTTGELKAVTLKDLGLIPLDTAALGADQITDLIQAADPGPYQPLSPEAMCQKTDGVAGPCTHALLRELLAAMGVRPAAVDDFDLPDTNLRTELQQKQTDQFRQRYRQLHALALRVLDHLRNDPAAAPQKLVLAARWGIAPRRLPEDQDDMNRLEAATNALATRLQHAPDPADTHSFAALSINELTQACQSLATSDGAYTLTAGFNLNQVAGPLQLDPDHGDLGNGLDAEWLSVVAAVRRPLAKIEAWQANQILGTLERHPLGDPKPRPLALFAHNPKDPWCVEAVRDARERDSDNAVGFHAFYTPDPKDFAAGKTMAVSIIDAWNETVPDPQHDAAVSFGFNAPGARAPQAILLAVPPDLNQPLDTDQLHRILQETRRDLRARMARDTQLNGFNMVVGAAFLPQHELGGRWTVPNADQERN